MVVYHINVVFFDEYRSKVKLKPYRVSSYRRLVICLLHNYVELIFLFAMFYRIFEFWFKPGGSICPQSLWGSLYFSVVTVTTLGYGDITPVNNWGTSLCIAETLIGIFIAFVMLTSFIRLLPVPKTKDWRE